MINKKYENFYDELSELKTLLTDKHIFDLVSALRGNDFGYMTIKYVFTARLRSFIMSNDDYSTVRFEKYISNDDVDLFIDELESMGKSCHNLHYFNHIAYAFNVLHIYELIEEWEYDILNEIREYIISYLMNMENKDDLIIKIRNTLNKLIKPKNEKVIKNEHA